MPTCYILGAADRGYTRLTRRFSSHSRRVPGPRIGREPTSWGTSRVALRESPGTRAVRAGSEAPPRTPDRTLAQSC